LPVPVRHETHHVAPPTHSALPLTDTTGPIVPTIALDHDLLPRAAVPEASIEVAPTALAYGKRTQVPYPKEALRRHEQGTVVLRVLVGADGIPQTVEIETSSGSPRLDRAARDAVLHWSFRPGTRDGAARSAWARVPVAFDLSAL
jgi:protein TonB